MVTPFERWWNQVEKTLRDSERGVKPHEETMLNSFRLIAEKGFEAGIDEGWEQAESFYGLPGASE